MDEPKPLSIGPVSSGSLLKSSEGVSLAGMLTLVTTIVTGNFDPKLQTASMFALGIAMAGYAISRGLAKRGSA